MVPVTHLRDAQSGTDRFPTQRAIASVGKQLDTGMDSGESDMSSVIAVPELVRGAAQDLARVGSSLSEAAASVSGPTTGIAAAAQDEVSAAIASLFGEFGQEFHGLGAQAQAFHTQFVSALHASAGAYVGAEVANSQTVFAASGQALNILFGGISTEFGLLATNPAAFVSNLQTAVRSLTLIGAPGNVVSAVGQHTLGGVTEAMGGLLGDTLVNDAHVQVLQGLLGDGFTPPPGLEGQLVAGLAEFASSPLSGVLIGFVGPAVSPGVALFNEGQTIFADVTGGDPAGALTELISTPATVVNSFFNGATLNLNPLAPVVNHFVSAGDDGGEQLNGLSLAFGGLFSPGQVIDGTGGQMYYGVGGSALNSLGLDLSFSPPDEDAGATIAIPPIPVGPIGATAGLIDIIGQAFGGTLLS